MLENVDTYIGDNPTLRRLQILEVVLHHCASYIWAKNKTKREEASKWAEQFKDKLRSYKASSFLTNSSLSQHDGGSETRKKGSNGLTVASADTIMCKKPKYHETGSTDHSTVDPNEMPQFDDVSTTASSFAQDARLTPATTQNGNVILVNSAGESVTDDLYESPDVPLAVKRLSGGITNELFHVYDPADGEHSLVVRVYGKETERVISRESELFYQSQFLDTYVHGRNFLIYQYLYKFEPLPYYEMADEADAVAENIAAFQVTSTIAAKTNMSSDRHKREVIGPAAEDPNNVDFVAAHGADKVVSRFDKEANYTVHSLTKWLSQISCEEIQSKVVPEKRASFAETVELLRSESRDMVELIEKEATHLVQGVCHNDLLSANIMRHKETRALKIIDFDYTKKNFLLFDIANHFNEYTGLECDYERYFPSDAHMTNFVRMYRRHMREHLEKARAASTTAEEKRDILSKQNGGPFRVFDNEETFYTSSEDDEEKIVMHWTNLVKFMTLCSHASWAIWSMFQEAVSNIDVDFLDYAKLRIARYMETKDEIKKVLLTTH